MAGLLYGLYERHPKDRIINFASAAAFGKLQEKSDATNQELSSVNKIVELYGAGTNH
jgi:2-dehydro-3-deoxygluconokinase